MLVQTLGVTSLLYIPIGYWAGRLREVRDPAHGLVPLVAGAAATAVAGIGMTLIQFLLGVDAPVSLLLVQQIFITILVNTLIALPVYAIVRKVVLPALPDDPAPAPAPRLHHRRPQPAAAALAAARPDPPELAMIELPEDRRPPMTPQLALRVAVAGTFALAMFAIIFFRLWFLQVLSGDQYLKAATVNRVRDIAIAAPRGEILDRNGTVLVSSTKALRRPDLAARSAQERRRAARRVQPPGPRAARSPPSRCDARCRRRGHLTAWRRSRVTSNSSWRSCPTPTSPSSRSTSTSSTT